MTLVMRLSYRRSHPQVKLRDMHFSRDDPFDTGASPLKFRQMAMKSIRTLSMGNIRQLYFLVILFFSSRILAQTNTPISVSIDLLCQGKSLTNGAVVRAPVTIVWFPNLETTKTLRPGDTVDLDFLVDGKLICSGKAEWHDVIRPSDSPGRIHPMIVARAGFGYSLCDWTNPPPGAHVVTLLAHGPGKLSATSPPFHITVLPRR